MMSILCGTIPKRTSVFAECVKNYINIESIIKCQITNIF